MCETMAIPFNLPTDEQTEDNYRRLDQLLVDLYSVLRHILMRPRYVPLPENDSRGPAPLGDVTASRQALPDLVSSTLPRQRRRRRCCAQVQRPLDTQEDSWLLAGDQLRKIAEELRATFISKQEATEEKPQPQAEVKMEIKSSGLFSQLVPQLRSSIWTTVFLLVGWRLLARAR